MTEPTTRTELDTEEKVKAKLWLDAISEVASEYSKQISEELAAEAKAEYQRKKRVPTWRFEDLANVVAKTTNEAAVVTNEAAFTNWVQSRYPSAVYTETKVSPAWKEAFLKRAIRRGGQVWDSTDEDEMVLVPGVEVKSGGEFIGISVSQKSKVATDLFAALADHGLRQLAAEAGSRPLALPGVNG